MESPPSAATTAAAAANSHHNDDRRRSTGRIRTTTFQTCVCAWTDPSDMATTIYGTHRRWDFTILLWRRPEDHGVDDGDIHCWYFYYYYYDNDNDSRPHRGRCTNSRLSLCRTDIGRSTNVGGSIQILLLLLRLRLRLVNNVRRDNFNPWPTNCFDNVIKNHRTNDVPIGDDGKITYDHILRRLPTWSRRPTIVEVNQSPSIVDSIFRSWILSPLCVNTWALKQFLGLQNNNDNKVNNNNNNSNNKTTSESIGMTLFQSLFWQVHCTNPLAIHNHITTTVPNHITSDVYVREWLQSVRHTGIQQRTSTCASCIAHNIQSHQYLPPNSTPLHSPPPPQSIQDKFSTNKNQVVVSSWPVLTC